MSHPLSRLPNVILEGGIYKVRRMVKGRRRKLSTGFGVGQEKQAERRVYELQTDLSNDRWGAKQVPTFDAWWATYQKTYTDRKPSTQVNYTKAVGWAMPDLTRRSLDSITPGLCTRILGRLRKGLAESTVRTYQVILKGIFQKAVLEGHIDKNPWEGTQVGARAVRTRVLALGEEARLRPLLSPFYDRWLTFMLGTGCRITEALHVLPSDLDFEAQSIRLRVTKNDKPRTVPMFPAVAAALRTQLEETPGQLWGKPQTKNTYDHMLGRRCKELGIPRVSPHVLRHTFGTRWLQEGKDIYLLSKILGHASVVITENHYAHLVPSDVVSLALKAGAPKTAGRIVAFPSGTGTGPGT